MKRKITKAEFDALADALKEHYKQEGDVYLLQVDDATELLAARDREKTRADEAIAEANRLREEKAAADKKIKDANDQAARDAAKASGDITALENSWKGKVDEAKAEGKVEADKLRGMIEVLTVDNVALALANDISISPGLILPHIKSRLKADLTGDKPLTRILDANGQPTANSLDDLKKEFVANKDFAAIIKGSDASGGSANGNNPGGSATGKKINEMTEAERVTAYNANPTAFKAQAKAEGVTVYQ